MGGPAPYTRWYQSTWGVILLSAGIFIIVGGFIMIGLIGKYWWQIRQGHGADLYSRFGRTDSRFSQAPLKNAANPSAIDRLALEISSAPHAGATKADVVVVEFIDFKCPNCQVAAPIMRTVLEKFGNRFTYIVRHFPVESTHPGASKLSEMGYCAHAQGKFWLLHDWLYAEQARLPEVLTNQDRAEAYQVVDLNAEAMEKCLADPQTAVAVNRDYAAGVAAGVRGTPTFFINGQKIEGVISLASWEKYFSQLKK